MSDTILLSKILGIFFIITGIAFALRRSYFIPAVADFAQARLLRTMVALIELLAGLFLVVIHTDWSSLPAGIITVIGWLAVIESSSYLVMPDQMMGRLLALFNKPSWYLWGGIIGIVIGVYLALFGFGFI